MTDKQEPTTAEKLRNEALEIFDGPETAQDVRDVIEWFYGSMLAAPPAPAAVPPKPVSVDVIRAAYDKTFGPATIEHYYVTAGMFAQEIARAVLAAAGDKP